jgi:hemolysin III
MYPSTPSSASIRHIWWRDVPYSPAERLWDAVVHAIGIAVTVIAGGTLLVVATAITAPEFAPAIALYVGALATVFVVSLIFNMTRVDSIKRLFARLDQAAIFLLIAGTYTPILSVLTGTPIGNTMLAVVWGGALIGVALKLIVPHHFGRLALLLYLAIGWSGITVFKTLSEALPPSTLWLLLAGGTAYSFGIIFHVWERLRFHNVMWHCFVVLGASLHLWAVLDCMVLRRL